MADDACEDVQPSDCDVSGEHRRVVEGATLRIHVQPPPDWRISVNLLQEELPCAREDDLSSILPSASAPVAVQGLPTPIVPVARQGPVLVMVHAQNCDSTRNGNARQNQEQQVLR